MKIIGIVVLTFLALFANIAMAETVVEKKNNAEEGYFDDWEKIDKIRSERQIHYTKVPEILKKGDAIILDVRSKESYDCGHIKGAKNLSLTDITEKTLPKIVPSKQTKIIIYCEKTLSPPVRRMAATKIAFPIIYKLGYENIHEIEEVMYFDDKTLKDFESVLPFEKSEKCTNK